MVANLAYNPYQTSNAAGSFNVQSDGYIQGVMLDDPAVRFALAGGVLAQSETLPMWGGVGISEAVPGAANTPDRSLGGIVTRATTLTAAAAGQLTGFSVFNQNHAMVNNPQSPVPLAGSGMDVHFLRLGSGARIAVACTPNLVNAEGVVITQNVSWDFENQQLTPYASTTISAGTYNSGTGAVSLTTAAAHGLNPGDTFELSGVTGTGVAADLDGEWTATAGTTGTTLNFTAPTGLTLTITGGNVATGGQLPVKVLDVNIGNSMTVSYNSGTNLATWDRSGNTALILI